MMMSARVRLFALAVPCLAFPLLSAAKPGADVEARRAATTQTLGKVNPSGLGTRTQGLIYTSVARNAFMPAAFLTSGLIAESGSLPRLDNQHTRFESGTASVQLPDGARLRELSCFGRDWSPDKNRGFGVKLMAEGLDDQASEELGRAKVIEGRGKRRLDASLDHVVDNFRFGYMLRMNLNVDARITGCRIGYEPPAQ